MGSSTENSAYKPTRNPWDADARAGRLLGGSAAAVAAALVHREPRHRHRRLDPPAGRVLRRRRAEAHVRPRLALRRHRVRVLARPGRARSRARSRTPPRCSRSIAGHDPRDATSLAAAVPAVSPRRRRRRRRAADRPAATSTSQARRRPACRERVDRGRRAARRRRRDRPTSRCRTRATRCRRTTWSRPPRRRRTWPATTACATACAPRAAGASRRSCTGAPAAPASAPRSSAASCSAPTRCAPATTTPTTRRRSRCARSSGATSTRRSRQVDVLLSPTTPTTAFPLGEKGRRRSTMYLGDVFTLSCNLAGLPGLSVPCGFDGRGPARRRAAPRQGARRGHAPARRRRVRGRRWHRRTPPRRPARAARGRRPRAPVSAHADGELARMLERLGGRDRPRGPRPARHAEQGVLAVRRRVRRAAQLAHRSGRPGPARRAAGVQPRRARARAPPRHRHRLADPRRARGSRASTTSTRTCPRAIRSRSTTSPCARTATSI